MRSETNQDEAGGKNPSAGRASLLVVFLVSAVMLILELLFPLVLLFLPERSGTATIIAIVMLGLGAGGLLYYLIPGGESGGQWAGRAIVALPFFILAGFFITVLVPGQAAAVLALAASFALISVYLSWAFVSLPPTRAYFVNLIGAALGAGIVFVFHPCLGEENGILASALLSGVAGWLASGARPWLRRMAVLGMALAFGLLGWNLATDRLDLVRLIPPSRLPKSREHDALSFAFRAAQAPDTKRLGVSHNLVSRVEAISAPNYELGSRYFPGGLAAIPDPGLRADLTASLDSPVKLYYMDHLWSQVVTPEARFSDQPPYNLLEHPRVLVIGPGGGVDIARAAWHQAERIVAVEINPGVIELMRGPLHDISGGVYDRAEVLGMDGRTYVRLTDENFDLIHLAFADLYVPLRNSDIFLENYLYTLEAFRDYYRRLTPRGIIAVYKWVRSGVWNKDLFRIATTARAMLEAEGVPDPGAHLVIVGMEGQPDQYLGYFLIRREPFAPAEVAALAQKVGPPLKIYWAPGLAVAPNPFRDIVTAPDLKSYLAGLEADLSPTTDDRPLFYLFDRGLTVHHTYFYFFLVVIGIVIVIPAAGLVVRERLFAAPRFWAAAIVFAALGIGYMFLQTTLLQKFNLFLGSPTWSLALVITVFLIGGGVGAELSRRVPGTLHVAVLPAAAALSLFYAFCLDDILAAAARPSLAARTAISVLLLAPLCLALGFPFPQALARIKASLGEKRAALFFAINGAGGSFAVAWFTLLVPTRGLLFCFVLGGVFYLTAAVFFPGLAERAGPGAK